MENGIKVCLKNFKKAEVMTHLLNTIIIPVYHHRAISHWPKQSIKY